MRQEGLEDALDVELRNAKPADHLGKPGPSAPHAADHLGAPRQDRAGIVVDVLAGHAGGHARAHDRADRRSGDRHRPDAEFVKRLDRMDMRQAARAAAAEGYGEARLARSRCSSRHPLLPSASGGPITRIAGSAVSSFLAAAFTSSSVTASMSAGRRSM